MLKQLLVESPEQKQIIRAGFLKIKLNLLATMRAYAETMGFMSINDPLIHPAFLDPRSWGDTNLYDTTVNIEREPVRGNEHHTPDRLYVIKHLKLDLRFDDETRQVSGMATLTVSPMSDRMSYLELDIAEMEISSV